MKSRIAPTPSGFLHRGNAFNFLLTERLVRWHGGSLLLRIDDIDRGRYRPEYLAHIFQTLQALEIKPDLGPDTPADFEEKWSQHLRLTDYRKTLDRLRSTGRVYACDCSRKKVNDEARNGTYGGSCRHKKLPLDQPGVNWRINTSSIQPIELPGLDGGQSISIDLATTMGDFVIRKKDGLPAYQVCSLTDDLIFDIDLIVRGEDLLRSSAAQSWLAGLLEERSWLANLRTVHHPLLLSDDGSKLSKSAGAAAIESETRRDFKTVKAAILASVEAWLLQHGIEVT